MLIDYCSLINEKCKILLSEPYDIGVYLTANKLASELNEKLDQNQTIGFQTINENKYNLKYKLQFDVI